VSKLSKLSKFSTVRVGIFSKKYSLALHLVEMNTDLDPQALDADPKTIVEIRPDSDPDQQH
jgi:hypothetical protein